MSEILVNTRQVWKNNTNGELMRIVSHVKDSLWEYKKTKLSDGLKGGLKNPLVNFKTGQIEERLLRKEWSLVTPKNSSSLYQYKSVLYELLYDDGIEIAVIPLGEKATAESVKIFESKTKSKFKPVPKDIKQKLFITISKGL